jgi:putative NIF3 family GTP cyclohydrolase 1 type 2
MRTPDSTLVGLLKSLEWEAFSLAEAPNICHIPPVTLQELLEQLKTRLDCKRVRYIGSPELLCRGVGILVGAQGGQRQIGVLAREDVDVLVCGEINEWEPNEYVRDALQQGKKKAMVIIGHAVSEKAGVEDISSWLQACVPEITLTYIPPGNSLEWS